MPTLSFTAKNFTQGVSPTQNPNSKLGGFFSETVGIDVFRWPGQICPGPAGTAMSSSVGTINDVVQTVKYIDGGSIGGWLLAKYGLYRIQSNNISESHTFTSVNATRPHSIIRARHAILGDGIFYFTDGDIGYWEEGSNSFYDTFGSGQPVTVGTVTISSGSNYVVGTGTNFLSSMVGQYFTVNGFTTTISSWTDGQHIYLSSPVPAPASGSSYAIYNGVNPTGAANLQTGYTHRACNLSGIIYFTNASFNNGNLTIGTYDFTTGLAGTLNPFAFSLPPGYVASDIKSVNGNVEIYASNGYRAVVILWDGYSGLATSITDIDDTNILAATTSDGVPYLVTSGNTSGISIRQKNYYGYPQVQNIQESGTNNTLTPNHVVAANGQLYIADPAKSYIYSYGTPYGDYSYRGTENTGTFPAVFQNFIATNGDVLCMDIYNGSLTVVYAFGSESVVYTYPLTAYTTYNNNEGAFQINFQDLPLDSAIDKITFFIQPPTGTYAFTPALYTDMNGSTPAWSPASGDDVKAGNLDANGYSKTYYGIGNLAGNFSIGGNWLNSPDNNGTIIIHRIDVTYSTAD